MKKIAIINQKGGVGKTTTAINLSAGLTRSGFKVLTIDLDSLACLTNSIIEESKFELSIADLIFQNQNINDIIVKTKYCDIIPSNSKLSSYSFPKGTSAYFILKRNLAKLNNKYDFVIFDCPGSLDILTTNALIAADSIIITCQTEYQSINALANLNSLISEIKSDLNNNLTIDGVLFTMFQKNRNIDNMCVNSVIESDLPTFSTAIRKDVKLIECQTCKKSIFDYSSKTNGSVDYTNFTEEVIQLWKQKKAKI